eukprot:gnl/TRDRNA2_/TRDRNA2_62052_c0_seq1.p1 gnl/TRDRNA2_/TRDRNA2_62052_c0~~gnl/TRDRNA2_/TRDRNA2_62052_c0_seq1.p1  ORF type:complete len:263 (+),score=6.64 gnl/TRDRNA2_/TRDRNA2_62052_c0_seq1:110-790(+)
MIPHKVPNTIEGSDQAWYQQYFLSHQSVIYLDSNCFLMCAITGDDDENGVRVGDLRISIPDTGTMPSLVHFVSVAHWPAWREGVATTALHEVFRHFYPSESARLLDLWRLNVAIGATHDIGIYEGPGFWRVMKTVLCVQCRILGSQHNECQYFPSLLDAQCAVPILTFLAFTALKIAIGCAFISARRRGVSCREALAQACRRCRSVSKLSPLRSSSGREKLPKWVL